MTKTTKTTTTTKKTKAAGAEAGTKTETAPKAKTSRPRTKTAAAATAAPTTAPAAPAPAPKAAAPSATPAAGRRASLVVAPPGQEFWVNNGPILHDLQQLRDALAAGRISTEQYAHHARGEHNDFANWVEHVLGDAACATKLRAAQNVKQALAATEASLVGYK